MKKLVVIIINGKGGCGKDTLIRFFKTEYKNTFNIANESSIDPIKAIARDYGYYEVSKDDKSRKFLSDLKRVFTEWNDLPLKYCMEMLDLSVKTKRNILFVHIREPEEIERFKQMAISKYKDEIAVLTLLIKSNRCNKTVYGNTSDDDVDNYEYDFIYNNNLNMEEAEYDFIGFMERYILPYMR